MQEAALLIEKVYERLLLVRDQEVRHDQVPGSVLLIIIRVTLVHQ